MGDAGFQLLQEALLGDMGALRNHFEQLQETLGVQLGTAAAGGGALQPGDAGAGAALAAALEAILAAVPIAGHAGEAEWGWC